jgi:hypothetical protein
MPLFSNKFFPKKPTSRKLELSTINKELAPEKALQDLGLEIGPIKLKLGDQESLFNNGEWVPGNRNSINSYYLLACLLRCPSPQVNYTNTLRLVRCIKYLSLYEYCLCINLPLMKQQL